MALEFEGMIATDNVETSLKIMKSEDITMDHSGTAAPGIKYGQGQQMHIVRHAMCQLFRGC